MSLSILLVAPAGAATQAAVTFHNPLHPEQCDLAIADGQREMRQGSTGRGRLILAEGLLCRGLQDNPWALDAAISSLRGIVRALPDEFFPALDLADALRSRYPVSDDAVTTLEQARTLLGRTDVGSAREEISSYIDENLLALKQSRERTLPELRRRADSLAAGSLPPVEVRELIAQLPLTGLAGVEVALQALDTFLLTHDDDSLDTFYRAEALRGRVPPDASLAMYAEAVNRLCGTRLRPENAEFLNADSEMPAQHKECELSRWRASQVKAVLALPDWAGAGAR